MPTKSEIESRVSRIVQIFKSAMPGIPAPYHQTLSQLSGRTATPERFLCPKPALLLSLRQPMHGSWN